MSYIEKTIETPSGKCTQFFSEDVNASGILMIHEGGEAWASEAPSLNLTSITTAVRDKELKEVVKGGELTGFITAVYISYLNRMKRNASDESERERWGYHIWRQMKGSGYDIARDEIKDGFFERIVEKQLVYTYNQAGHVGVLVLGKLIKLVEMKSRFPTEDELFMLKCIKEAAEEAEGVPTKGRVEELWTDYDKRHSHETYVKMRNRLGFSWLPQSKGGKPAPGREKTWGKGRLFFPD